MTRKRGTRKGRRACELGGPVSGRLQACLREAVRAWAVDQFRSEEVHAGAVVDDAAEDRYLVDFAVRTDGYWRIAEVWVEQGDITLINDLGEGFPADDAGWPWAEASPGKAGGEQ